MFEEKLLTVTQFNTVVKNILENDELLDGVCVRGEISNFKAYPSGHFYFSLKDEGSALSCVMFAGSNRALRFRPADGMQVKVHGSATVYVKDGRYQFLVRSMEADGAGGLLAAYEKLKEKLEKEGLFDEARKKTLPKFPLRVGVITSGAGAAFRDILNVTGRRFPTAQILLYPSLVQGEDAPASLIEGVRWFSERRNVDVLIIGRGGGSIEDLWAFNDEGLARALAACPIPTISAVGHETDFTICDFVCDRRAPTPSAAAELAVPEKTALQTDLLSKEERMQSALLKSFREKREKLDRLKNSRPLTDPHAAIAVKAQALEALAARFAASSRLTVERKRAALAALAGKTATLNPMSVLARGYGAVFDPGGRVIKSAGELRENDRIVLRLHDGRANATVNEVFKEGE